MYKLLSTDLDGTLLRDDKTISDETIDSINKMIENGYHFVVSTGRPYRTSINLISGIKYNIPMILNNGAEIMMKNTKEFISLNRLDKSLSLEIKDLLDSINATYIIWKNDILYTNKINKYSIDYKEASKVEPMLIDDNFEYSNISKIMMLDEEDEINKMIIELDKHAQNFNYFTSSTTYLEFVGKNVSKAQGIKEICSILNIKIEDVVACGDGYNDLEMIKTVGHGVIMSNAQDSLKKYADEIAPSNEEEGIKYIINKYFNNESPYSLLK